MQPGRDGGALATGVVGSGSPAGGRWFFSPGPLAFAAARQPATDPLELPDGGGVTTPVPPDFQGFAYLLEGEAAFGANRRRARPPQLVLLGPGESFGVTEATPRTRFLLMAGRPYGEEPVFNGPYVD